MIGAETERTAKHHRNEDIDSERTPLNYYFKKIGGRAFAGLEQHDAKLWCDLQGDKKIVCL